ncbi:MAG: hypothetical protein GY810_32085 [Aureispira sp.]|nr:hypothetical protein [Aureispira sp.]
MKDLIQFAIGLVTLALVAFGLFYFFEIQVGSINDWLVGIISFLWLVVITTVPWNAHFKAKEVLDDAEISKRKDILVIESSLDYVKKIAKRSLILAIALHIFSAVGLYFIASLGVSQIGYFAAALAIALTVLRPTVRFYDYLRRRLDNIKQEFRYPREDLQTLLDRTNHLETVLDDREGAYSWRNDVIQEFKNISKQLEDIQKRHNHLKEEYKKDINNLTTEIAKLHNVALVEIEKVGKSHDFQLEKLTTDSKVLDAVRELAKFVGKLKE